VTRSTIAFFALAALLAAAAPAPAAELPTLHKSPDKSSAETPSETGKGFDLPGSGLHVTFGGYIEGAVIATSPRHAAATVPARARKSTP
jgi:hypothetical protein